MNPNVLPEHDFSVADGRALYAALASGAAVSRRAIGAALRLHGRIFHLRSRLRSCSGCVAGGASN